MADALRIDDLHVYYGESPALQGVSLGLEQGILSVVGRNGMGKTTLCNATTGLKRARSGSIRVNGREISAQEPHEIYHRGVGYVPRGRRVRPSLTADEHPRLASGTRRDASWTVDRVHQTFPRLAERRRNGGARLSGGKQQMFAISRALPSDPELLIMDEPNEGLAPVIVRQVEAVLIALAAERTMSILVIEQNIGVATAIADRVAIVGNGRIKRIMEPQALAADRDPRQCLLGVGRHTEDDAPPAAVAQAEANLAKVYRLDRGHEAAPYIPVTSLPNRWNLPVSDRRQPAAVPPPEPKSVFAVPCAGRIGRTALVAGSFDTKGRDLRFMADRLTALGLPVKTVDLSTSGKPARADIPASQIAILHPRGLSHVLSGDRGAAVTAIAASFALRARQQPGIGGLLSAGGSGGTAIAIAGMRALLAGLPKIMVSTVASADVGACVCSCDILMDHAMADGQGLNSITETVPANAAHAMAGMVAQLPTGGQIEAKRRLARAALGLTMFGVTTPAVRSVVRLPKADDDCLVIHPTGTSARWMDALADSQLLPGFLDLTTTEVADMLAGGVFAATQDRFGAAIRTSLPYAGSLGALDMANFGPRDTVPAQFSNRKFGIHNPGVTLMRTTPAENRVAGEWIAGHPMQMTGPVTFLLPMGGVSMLDAPGQPFHDPEADAALFQAVAATFRTTPHRPLLRVPANINDPAFALAAVDAFRATSPKTQRRA